MRARRLPLGSRHDSLIVQPSSRADRRSRRASIRNAGAAESLLRRLAMPVRGPLVDARSNTRPSDCCCLHGRVVVTLQGRPRRPGTASTTIRATFGFRRLAAGALPSPPARSQAPWSSQRPTDRLLSDQPRSMYRPNARAAEDNGSPVLPDEELQSIRLVNAIVQTRHYILA
jgi:hypothetical protein